MLYRITRAGDGQRHNQLCVSGFNNIRQKSPVVVSSLKNMVKFLLFFEDMDSSFLGNDNNRRFTRHVIPA